MHTFVNGMLYRSLSHTPRQYSFTCFKDDAFIVKVKDNQWVYSKSIAICFINQCYVIKLLKTRTDACCTMYKVVFPFSKLAKAKVFDVKVSGNGSEDSSTTLEGGHLSLYFHQLIAEPMQKSRQRSFRKK